MTTDQGPSSPKEARQQARIAKAQRKAGRNWFLRHKILTGIGALIVIAIVASIASSGGKSGNGTASPVGASSGAPAATSSPKAAGAIAHSEDIAISTCAADELGYANSKVVITNHSSKPSNYIVTIAMDTPDGKTQIGTGNAVVNNLAPGQASAAQDANTLMKAPAGGYVCKLASVTRYSSNG